MKSVGIRELKNNLSKYLHLVKTGETIIITEHERVIAEIKKPSEFLNDSKKRAYLYLEEQNRIGNVRLAKRNKSQIESIIEEFKEKKPILEWKKLHTKSRSDRF
ncbi:MAG: type II toxin-antitoxin system prevent-host-death family antitoxin [Spirochaetia bacterium]|nr:type II toxin-antitoxin system prevent-host-death family antitoxin [Spirochaetia bacterium]